MSCSVFHEYKQNLTAYESWNESWDSPIDNATDLILKISRVALAVITLFVSELAVFAYYAFCPKTKSETVRIYHNCPSITEKNNLEMQKHNLTKKKTELEADNTQLKKEIQQSKDELVTQKSTLEEKIKSKEKEIEDLKIAKFLLNGHVYQRDLQITRLKQLCEQGNQKSSNHATAINDLNNEIQKLQSMLKEAKDQIAEKDQQCKSLEDSAAGAQTSVEEKTAQVKRLEEEISKLQEELKRVNEELVSSEHSLNSLKSLTTSAVPNKLRENESSDEESSVDDAVFLKEEVILFDAVPVKNEQTETLNEENTDHSFDNPEIVKIKEEKIELEEELQHVNEKLNSLTELAVADVALKQLGNNEDTVCVEATKQVDLSDASVSDDKSENVQINESSQQKPVEENVSNVSVNDVETDHISLEPVSKQEESVEPSIEVVLQNLSDVSQNIVITDQEPEAPIAPVIQETRKIGPQEVERAKNMKHRHFTYILRMFLLEIFFEGKLNCDVSKALGNPDSHKYEYDTDPKAKVMIFLQKTFINCRFAKDLREGMLNKIVNMTYAQNEAITKENAERIAGDFVKQVEDELRISLSDEESYETETYIHHENRLSNDEKLLQTLNSGNIEEITDMFVDEVEEQIKLLQRQPLYA